MPIPEGSAVAISLHLKRSRVTHPRLIVEKNRSNSLACLIGNKHYQRFLRLGRCNLNPLAGDIWLSISGFYAVLSLFRALPRGLGSLSVFAKKFFAKCLFSVPPAFKSRSRVHHPGQFRLFESGVTRWLQELKPLLIFALGFCDSL